MEDSTLRCSICAKSFSGVVPYSQHMQSAKHLKRQKQVENEKIHNLPTTDEGKLYCSTCDMKFSGIIPYGQHMNGSIHNKNVRRQKLINNLYADYIQTPQETLPQNPNIYTWGTGIEDMSTQRPHSSHTNAFDLLSLQEQLVIISSTSGHTPGTSTPVPLRKQPPYVPSSGAASAAGSSMPLHSQLPAVSSGGASGSTTSSYSLFEEVNNAALKMNIPQVPQTEGRLKGCGICGIPYFKSSEDHINHLESDEHFLKKLMSVKSVKTSANSCSDLGYGSMA